MIANYEAEINQNHLDFVFSSRKKVGIYKKIDPDLIKILEAAFEKVRNFNKSILHLLLYMEIYIVDCFFLLIIIKTYKDHYFYKRILTLPKKKSRI